VVDEVLARASLLVGVTLAGEGEGTLDRPAVDLWPGLGRVLAGDSEQIAEQRSLVIAEVLGDLVQRCRGRVAGVLDADPGVAGRLEGVRIQVPTVLELALVGR